MAAYRVRALPSALPEFDGDLAPILKDGVIESPCIWPTGVHPVIADRTVHCLAYLAYSNLN